MRPGDRIDGRFVIEAHVGSGGMGAVYRATDEHSGTTVAVKIVRSPSDRFDREADLLARLSHPGIVRHLAHGRTAANEQYLVMDWLNGEDLQRRLGRGRLTPGQALALARVLTGALAEVHARGIVHRDIKPSNIWLVDGNPERPVLLDFGIARAIASTRLTATGAMVGTPQFMAPEQVQGTDIDARTDVYAIGAVLFECIAGRPVFVGDHALALLAKVVIEQPPTLRDLQPETPEQLSQLVQRTLAKRPDDRPADARALATELERVTVDGETRVVTTTNSPARIGVAERRLVCVVMAGADASAAADTATPEQVSDELVRARELAHDHGAELIPLAGGYVAASTSSGIATDHARRVARYALELAAALPSAPVALAMGWGTVEPVPVGDAIDRVVSLLRVGRAPGSGVRIDDVSAGLLEVSCDLARDDSGHVLVGERRAGERPRMLLGRPTTCVGRDRDLRVLEDLFAEVCEDGVARAALVTAPAGGGKSRIRYELLGRLNRSDAQPTIAMAHAEMLRAGSPLDLLARCVRALVGVDEAALGAAVREQLRASFATLAPDAAPEIVEFLCEIVGVSPPTEGSNAFEVARGDARAMGDQMLRAWLTLLSAVCRRGPCVLVLEDLHWGDPQTVRFVDAALRELSNAPLLVLAFARPDVHDRFPGLWRDRPLREIRLGALPPKACARLVREILTELDEAAIDRIVERCEGNAFFLEEIIRASAGGATDAAPTSVVAMVQARLDALDSGIRRVVRAASVFGETCRLEGVAAVLGAENAAVVEPALAHLVASEVMTRRPRGEALDEYAFRHALVREAAYAALTDDDRQVAHGVAARWLEEEHERDALLLAGHYEIAGARADAARCWAEAAHQALEKNDFDAALARGKHALDLEPADPTRRRALMALGRTSSCLGRWNDAQRDLEAALALTSEPAQRIELLRDLCRIGIFRQEADFIERTSVEALAIGKQLERPELVSEATAAQAMADHCRGNVDEATTRYLTACEAQEQQSVTHGFSGIILYHVARFDDALRWNAKGLVPALEARDWWVVANQYANMALAYVGRGEYEAAEEHFRKGRETAERCGLTTMVARSVALSCGWQAALFDYDGAQRTAEEARYIGRDLEFSTPRVSALIDLATVALRRAQPDDAEQMLDSIANVIANGPGCHGWLWRLRNAVLRADIAAVREDWNTAVQLAGAAAIRCDEYRRVKYAIIARNVQARALAALGRTDEAMLVLARARADADRCGDPCWRLDVALTAMACGDRDALGPATSLAAQIERALPPARAAIFRASRELSILG